MRRATKWASQIFSNRFLAMVEPGFGLAGEPVLRAEAGLLWAGRGGMASGAEQRLSAQGVSQGQRRAACWTWRTTSSSPSTVKKMEYRNRRMYQRRTPGF